MKQTFIVGIDTDHTDFNDWLDEHDKQISANVIDKVRTELIDTILGDKGFTAWQKEEIILCIKYAIRDLKE